MTATASDPASAGIELAHDRLRRHKLPFSPSAITPTIEATVRLLQQADSPVPDRAAEIAVETVTIAAMMRVHYKEPELGIGEIAEFLTILRQFMNSWWHE